MFNPFIKFSEAFCFVSLPFALLYVISALFYLGQFTVYFTRLKNFRTFALMTTLLWFSTIVSSSISLLISLPTPQVRGVPICSSASPYYSFHFGVAINVESDYSVFRHKGLCRSSDTLQFLTSSKVLPGAGYEGWCVPSFLISNLLPKINSRMDLFDCSRCFPRSHAGHLKF